MRFFDIYVMVFIFNLFDLTLVKLIIEIEKYESVKMLQQHTVWKES